MRISEVFNSFQGEGIFTGYPSIFIRTAGCNLKCDWCDTKYSWGAGKEMSSAQILEQVEKYPYSEHVVITGGEPLLQRAEVADLVVKIGLTKKITIETNGTLAPLADNYSREVTLYSVSPKLQSAKQNLTWLPVVSHYVETYPDNLQLKFVVVTDEDYEELKVALNSIKSHTKYLVPLILQPNGMSNTLAEYAKAYGDLAMKVVNDPFFTAFNVRVMMQNHRVAFKQRSGI